MLKSGNYYLLLPQLIIANFAPRFSADMKWRESTTCVSFFPS